MKLALLDFLSPTNENLAISLQWVYDMLQNANHNSIFIFLEKRIRYPDTVAVQPNFSNKAYHFRPIGLWCYR